MNIRRLFRPNFYGWHMVGVGFLIYGLGIGPAYYSWGFFAPELIAELGLSRQQIGQMFGAFTVAFALASPVAAVAIRRVGVRTTVTGGALLAAAGFWMVSRAESAQELYIGYSLIGGLGIGFSTLLPAQSLPVFWFRTYRARATAVILLGAGIVGGLVTPVDALILRHWDWRTGWQIIAGVSVLVALIAALFIRNQPSDLGQRRDGRAVEDPSEADAPAAAKAPRGTVLRAVRTPQFWIASFAAATNTIPWRVMTAHGALHLEDLNFGTTAAGAILGVRVGASSFGRLTGSLGDFMAPTRVLALALIANAVGLAFLVSADTALVAYPCVFALGVAYGAAYTSVPVVFAEFFGRAAFVGTSGVRIALIGVIGYVGPTWAGAAADRTGSYAGTLWVLVVLALLGAASIWFCRPPDRSLFVGHR